VIFRAQKFLHQNDKMRLKVLVLLLCSTLILASDDEKSAEKSSQTSTEKAETAAKTDTDKTETFEICKKCNCEVEVKTVDCQDLKITELFSIEQFKALNDSKVPQDILRLNNNELTTITQFPALLIKTLILHRNKINKIAHAAFSNLTLLEELDLSSNGLTTEILIPEVFEGHYSPTEYEPLENLKILRLSNNDLHALNQDLFEHLPSLEVLSLDSNPIMTIDHLTAIALSDIPHLKFLDLSDLKITELPITLFNTPRQLNTLNLTGNLLTTIPEALQFAVNLQTLFLDENDIKYIGGENHSVFPSLTKLEYLSISYTTLKSIGEGAFSKLTSLKTLKLNNNPHLSSIHPKALSKSGEEDPIRLEYPPLTELYLHNNNISTLDANLFPHWDNLDIIDIRHNPWVCDCENQWVISNLLPEIILKHPTMSKDLICNHPKAMVGKELVELLNKHSKLRCSDRFNHLPEGDGTILVGILIGILIGIPMALAIVFVYKRGCFGLSRNRGAAAYSRAFYKRAEMGDEFRI